MQIEGGSIRYHFSGSNRRRRHQRRSKLVLGREISLGGKTKKNGIRYHVCYLGRGSLSSQEQWHCQSQIQEKSASFLITRRCKGVSAPAPAEGTRQTEIEST